MWEYRLSIAALIWPIISSIVLSGTPAAPSLVQSECRRSCRRHFTPAEVFQFTQQPRLQLKLAFQTRTRLPRQIAVFSTYRAREYGRGLPGDFSQPFHQGGSAGYLGKFFGFELSGQCRSADRDGPGTFCKLPRTFRDRGGIFSKLSGTYPGVSRGSAVFLPVLHLNPRSRLSVETIVGDSGNRTVCEEQRSLGEPGVHVRIGVFGPIVHHQPGFRILIQPAGGTCSFLQ